MYFEQYRMKRSAQDFSLWRTGQLPQVASLADGHINSLGGSVVNNVDLLLRYSLHIVAEMDLRVVRRCLNGAS